MKAFEAAYGAKFPKATAKITDDEEELLAFYDYPAEHWVHLRTTNPHLVALVRNGAVFYKGKLLERPIDIPPPGQAGGQAGQEVA